MISEPHAGSSYPELRKYLDNALAGLYEQPALEAVWNHFLDFIFNTTRKSIVLNPHSGPDETNLQLFKSAVARLRSGEPLQYITGKTWFAGHVFQVSPAVLIPRPETEELVAVVSEAMAGRSGKLLDIGTGSGCIAVSLKLSHPDWSVTGLDISDDALEVALVNNLLCPDGKGVNWIKADILNPSSFQELNVKFDILVSNPPYITLSEADSLPELVTRYEPALALFSGNDPLRFYRAILDHAKQILTPGGLVFFEIHEDYGRDLVQLMETNGFHEVGLIQDIYHKNRIIRGKNKT